MRKLFHLIWKIITAPFRFIVWILRSIGTTLTKGAQNVTSFFKEEEIEDAPIGDTLSATIENPRALLPHLNALRKHLLRAVLAIVITTAISFLFVREILSYLAAPLEGGIHELVAIDVTENIGTVMRVTLLSGFTIALPYIIFEIWLFIAPALKLSSRIKRTICNSRGHSSVRGGYGICFLCNASNCFAVSIQFYGSIYSTSPFLIL